MTTQMPQQIILTLIHIAKCMDVVRAPPKFVHEIESQEMLLSFAQNFKRAPPMSMHIQFQQD
jgi:hypothetical protein